MRRALAALALSTVAVASVALAQTPAGVDDGTEEAEPATSEAVPPPAHSAVRVAVPQKDGMLLVPAEHFTMGSNEAKAAPNEKPAHIARAHSFWVDRTEVTVAAYRACVEAGHCAEPQRTSALCTYGLGDDQLPVSCVRWQDADAYCRANGKRLPREGEWELAARGTGALRYPWGNVTSCYYAATLVNDHTARSCTGRHPARVGTYPMGASVYGALDMAGNVEEWTADWYAEHVGLGVRPTAGASHVLRGGGWLSRPIDARTSARDWGSALEAGPNVGFRCAKDP